MKTLTLTLGFSILVATNTFTISAEKPCTKAKYELQSQEEGAYRQGLQDVLAYNCTSLLPTVAEYFTKGKSPRFEASEVLALSGEREFGPFLVEAYIAAAQSAPGYDFAPGSLRSEMLVACSDLPRGKEIGWIRSFTAEKGVPELHKECIDKLREEVNRYSGMGNEIATRNFAIHVLDLVNHTSAAQVIDLVKQYLKSPQWEIREAALVSLEHTPLEDAFPLLREGALDKSDLVRFQAVRLLVRYSGEQVDRILRECLAKETYPPIVRMLRAALGEGGEQSAP